MVAKLTLKRRPATGQGLQFSCCTLVQSLQWSRKILQTLEKEENLSVGYLDPELQVKHQDSGPKDRTQMYTGFR